MKRSRINELKGKMLGVLDCGRGVHASQVEERIGGDYTQKEYRKAAEELQKEGEIRGNEYGWWIRTTPIRIGKLTRDDMEWLLGTGYYSQD